MIDTSYQAEVIMQTKFSVFFKYFCCFIVFLFFVQCGLFAKDVAILTNPENARFEFAESTAKTVKAKADFMLSNHSRGFVTKAGKLNEACRGLAKEIKSKLIPNMRNSRIKLHATKGVKYFIKLQNVLEKFGKNEIGITEAEGQVKNLTGKSLSELPNLVSNSLKSVIMVK